MFLIFFQNTTLLILFPSSARLCVLPAARWRGGQMLGCSVEPQQETDRVPSRQTAPPAGQDGHCIWVTQPYFEIQHVWTTNVKSFINNTIRKWLAVGYWKTFCCLVVYLHLVWMKFHNLKVVSRCMFSNRGFLILRRSSTTVLTLPSSPSFLISFTKSSSYSLYLTSNRYVLNLTLQITCWTLE